MKIKLTKRDYIWSYVGVFFSVCLYIIMTPFALYYLEADMYGLWGVFQSVAGITTLFDFGFSTTFARNINYCWCGAKELKKTGVIFADSQEPNYKLMKCTMTACKYVFLAISLIAFLIMATIGTGYIEYICRDVDGNTPLIAWGLYLIAIFLNLYYGYFNSFLRGIGAIAQVNLATVTGRIIQIVATVTLLIAGYGIVGTGIAYLLYGLVFRILSKRSFYNYKGLGKALKKTEENTDIDDIKQMFFIVWHNASREGIVTLANYLANQACTIICSLFMTLSVTGVYSLAVQLATAISNVAGVFYTANQPVLQSAYISQDKKKMRKTMALIVVSFVIFFSMGIILVITVGIPILRFIKPDVHLERKLMIGVALYQFMLKYRNCYTSYFSCTNRIPYVRAFLMSSLLCVCLAYTGLKMFDIGITWLVLAQIISQGIYNFWYWARRAHIELELSIKDTICLGIEELFGIIVSFVRKGETNNV